MGIKLLQHLTELDPMYSLLFLVLLFVAKDIPVKNKSQFLFSQEINSLRSHNSSVRTWQDFSKIAYLACCSTNWELVQTFKQAEWKKKKKKKPTSEIRTRTWWANFLEWLFLLKVLINHSSVLTPHGPFLCHSSTDHFSVILIVVVNSL